jgi:hypothetical protein
MPLPMTSSLIREQVAELTGRRFLADYMSPTEKALYDRWAEAAIPVSAPFAAAQGLSPEVWKAIGILLKGGM